MCALSCQMWHCAQQVPAHSRVCFVRVCPNLDSTPSVKAAAQLEMERGRITQMSG